MSRINLLAFNVATLRLYIDIRKDRHNLDNFNFLFIACIL